MTTGSRANERRRRLFRSRDRSSPGAALSRQGCGDGRAARPVRLAEYRRRRREHTVEAEDGEVCLLDLGARRLLAALRAVGGGNAFEDTAEEATLRTARLHYLAGRKAEAADALYPAVCDALGVLV